MSRIPKVIYLNAAGVEEISYSEKVPPHFELYKETVHIPISHGYLEGILTVPEVAKGIVIFAHGSGSSRHSPRNQFVAENLQQSKLATLLVDLLTMGESVIDARTRHLRFDIGLLSERLMNITAWVMGDPHTRGLPIGYFGASTGAAAAIVAAAKMPDCVSAVVSRGGRPDLAGEALKHLRAPTLLLVGSEDRDVLNLNESARRDLSCTNRIIIVEGATHLFEEAGTLEDVSELTTRWFDRFLLPPEKQPIIQNFPESDMA